MQSLHTPSFQGWNIMCSSRKVVTRSEDPLETLPLRLGVRHGGDKVLEQRRWMALIYTGRKCTQNRSFLICSGHKEKVSFIQSCSDSLLPQWTAAHQFPLSRAFPRQACWSGLPFPPPGDLSMSPALASGFFTTKPPGKSKEKTHTMS